VSGTRSHGGLTPLEEISPTGKWSSTPLLPVGYRNRTDLADSLQFTVCTLADIDHGVRKASPGTYAMLENKLAWARGSIDTILAGGEPNELVSTLHRGNLNTPSQGYALRPTP
jgi:hypothetical protein